MGNKLYVLAGLSALVALGIPVLADGPSREFAPIVAVQQPTAQEIQRQKNRDYIERMNQLPGKIEALMKKSPDFVNGS
jgi:hypothetical protein